MQPRPRREFWVIFESNLFKNKQRAAYIFLISCFNYGSFHNKELNKILRNQIHESVKFEKQNYKLFFIYSYHKLFLYNKNH